MVSLAGLRVLLAEDNPTNQMVAMQMLESLGAAVVLAEDGVEALEHADAQEFDVGLIDIEMPRLSGTDVIRRLRAGPLPHCDIPLIALTAYVMLEHRAAISEAGADGVIAKPILSIQQLGQEILAICEARRRSLKVEAPSPSPQASAQPAAPRPASDRGTEGEIDLAVFQELTSAVGPSGIGELLSKVDADIIATRHRILNGLERVETKPLREASHVLIAVAGSIGATRLQKDAQCLNSAAHSGDIQQMKQLSRVVLEEIDELSAFVRSKLQG